VRQWPYAGFVPGYSGGTVPVFHRLPYYAIYGHPNTFEHNIYGANIDVKKKTHGSLVGEILVERDYSLKRTDDIPDGARLSGLPPSGR
jgi:hypothetical protein